MKKLLLILFALVSQYSITVVHAQSLTTANTGIKIPTDDIHSIISNHSTEEDLNNLKTDLQAKELNSPFFPLHENQMAQ